MFWRRGLDLQEEHPSCKECSFESALSCHPSATCLQKAGNGVTRVLDVLLCGLVWHHISQCDTWHSVKDVLWGAAGERWPLTPLAH
jgi:hypothetical protein